MPLGMIYTISQIASLTSHKPEIIILCSWKCGNIYNLNTGLIKIGYRADLLIIDAPLGGTKKSALGALKNGDPCAIGSVISSGVPRFVGRSANTPTIRKVKVEKSEIREMFH